MSNNPQGTAIDGPLSNEDAVARLVGSLEDSAAAPSYELDSDVEADDEQSAGLNVDNDDERDQDRRDAKAEDQPDDDGDSDAGDDADEAVEYEAADDADDGEGEEYVFEINGEEITLDEIEKSYFRQQDYTKKTQDLAEQRKQFEQEKASIAQERAHLKQMLDALGNQDQESEQVDWVKLAETDPLEYTRQRAIYEASKAQRDAREAERQRLAQQQQVEHQRQLAEYAEQQAQLMAQAIPELTTEQGTTYKANIARYMEGIGYSKEELGQLYDHRAVVLADKARKYDELMAKDGTARKKVKGKPKVLRPGKPKTKRMTAQRNTEQARARLRKSGSVQDAVALLTG